MRYFLGITLIVLALGIGIIPQYTTCEHEGKFINVPKGTIVSTTTDKMPGNTMAMGKTPAVGDTMTVTSVSKVPMKCSWTARAELAFAFPLAGVGIMSLFGRRRETMRNLSIMGIILGVFVMLLPTQLIPVCTMGALDETVMKPSLLAMGGVAIAASLVGLVIYQRRKEIEI
ncbi:MAG: DUF4418 family protein [Chloroflexi bacterium]|nr:DUF4418 family protein [Chloroflexota bacterium]